MDDDSFGLRFHEKQVAAVLFFFFQEVWSETLNKYLMWLRPETSVQVFVGAVFFSVGEN